MGRNRGTAFLLPLIENSFPDSQLRSGFEAESSEIIPWHKLNNIRVGEIFAQELRENKQIHNTLINLFFNTQYFTDKDNLAPFAPRSRWGWDS